MVEKFTFFAKSSSVFSQWYEGAPFERHGIRFKTAENFMMWRKGQLFGASPELLKALIEASPRDAKALGRQIPNFNVEVWKIAAKPFVAEGNYAKFTQNKHALVQIHDTHGSTLVEAAPWDRIWGIGLAADDVRAASRDTWLGSNWLGEVLTDVRDTLATGAP